MVSNSSGNGLDCVCILLHCRRVFDQAGTIDFLHLDEFVFRSLRGVHAVAGVRAHGRDAGQL